jgi:hypothetical protein
MAFAWRDWGKPQKNLSQEAGVLAEIWTEYLPDTSLKSIIATSTRKVEKMC